MHGSLGKALYVPCSWALAQAHGYLRTSLYLLCFFLALCSAHNRPYKKKMLVDGLSLNLVGTENLVLQPGESMLEPLNYILTAAKQLP